MLKITKTKGTKLTHKSGTLKDLSEKGFLIQSDDGDEFITLDLIRDYFLDKEVKITIEEVFKEVLEV